jgi:hypothetical protein
LLSLVLLLAASLGTARADPLTPGNFLVSDETFGAPGRVREFTPSGDLVQTFTFPSPAPGGDGQPRSIIVDSNSNIQIYNGTFHPVLTTLDPVSGTVVNNTSFPGWSTINNTTYGGLGAFDHYVFATSTKTGSSDQNGIIRFDVNDYSGVRFGSNDYIQLAIGLDGLLYAQTPPTSPGGYLLDVFDPTTLAFQRTINLGLDLRSIAVDENGNIFATNINDSHIYQFDTNGVLQNTVDTGVRGLSEIVISNSDQLLAASNGTLVLTDTSLSSFTTLDVGTISPVDTFVAWVESPQSPPDSTSGNSSSDPLLAGPSLSPAPEPSSLILLGMGGAGLAGYTWRRKKPSA